MTILEELMKLDAKEEAMPMLDLREDQGRVE